jgi:hypothetical protein
MRDARPRHRLSQPIGHGACSCDGRLGQQDRELFAAEPGGDIRRPTRRLADGAGHDLQALVADRMAVGVLELL